MYILKQIDKYDDNVERQSCKCNILVLAVLGRGVYEHIQNRRN